MEKTITELNNLIEKRNDWWLDDPRDFLTLILNARTQLISPELSDFVALWSLDTAANGELELLLTNLKEALPERPSGELIYLMSYLEGKGSSHLTLLGPAIFPSDEDLHSFLRHLKELLGNRAAPIITLGDHVTLKKDKTALLVKNSDVVRELHRELFVLAESFGAIFPERHFALDSYLPHISDRGYELKDSESFTLGRVSVSLHPGARVNVANAREIASFRLRS